jgi:hypothetical protein
VTIYYSVPDSVGSGEKSCTIDQEETDRLSADELHQIMSGRTNVDDVYAKRLAERRKTAQQKLFTGHFDLTAIEHRLAEVEAHNESLQRRVANLEYQLAATPTIIDGKLPSKADITQLWCQVFYTPDLSPKERKTKTEWSLRLTVWINGQRVKREINVRLFSTDRFYRQAMDRNSLPKITNEWATALQHEQDALAGMLTATTQGRGRPFIASQFCVLNGHLIGSPTVDLVIDSDVISFENVRPSKGTSKWFFDWHA